MTSRKGSFPKGKQDRERLGDLAFKIGLGVRELLFPSGNRLQGSDEVALARYLAPHLHAHGLPPLLQNDIESDHVRYANRLVQLGRRLSVLQLGDEHHAHVAHLGKLSLGVSEPLASLVNRCSKVLRVPNAIIPRLSLAIIANAIICRVFHLIIAIEIIISSSS